MSRYIFKMPDLGEGTVSAEVVAWHVKPGDLVHEDQVMCEVMTEKAAVEMPAPVTGRVLSTTGQPGDMVAVGSELVVFDTDATSAASGDAPVVKAPAPPPPEPLTPQRRASDQAAQKPAVAAATAGANGNGTGTHKAGRVMASPASRRRAAEAGLDLSTVTGTGHAGRIAPGDIDSALAAGAAQGAPPSMNARANATRDARNGTEEVKIIGLRRVIAERLTESAKSIPQYSYVEEIDLTRLEALRKHLNDRRPAAAPPLTFLPFIVAALARVLAKFPQCNALYDTARGVLVKHNAVHVGIATQTPQGLKVPVVRNAESRALHDLAGRDPPRVRSGAGQQVAARRAHRVDDHRHQPRQAGRHRLDADDQHARGGHHRHQQGHRARRGGRRPDHRAPDDESVLVVRSPLRGRLRRGLDDPGAQGPARAAGDDLHRLTQR